jgi:sugar O-acyltransferase (sialic acid O-acetyltransferase NeuD family)
MDDAGAQMSRVVIFGTTDFAQVARTYLDQDSDHEVVAFTVNERYIAEDNLEGLPVVPFEQLSTTHPPDQHAMLVAIGFSRVNRARAEVYQACKELGYELITYVSSRATVAADAELGDNCFIYEENVIQPYVRIGNDVIVWSGNHIGHHTRIADHCFIASHAVISGRVTIGERCFVGVNATFRDGVTVAPDCVIGAGALIMKDTREGEVYAVRATDVFPKKSWELEGF